MRNKVVGSGRLILLIAVVVFLVWAGAIPGNFVYDDFSLIVDNAFIKSFRNIPFLFSSNYIASPVRDYFYNGTYNLGSGESSYRPVATVTYMLNYALFGLRPWGWRLVNVLLHVASSVLLYILLLRLFANPRLSALGALLFGVHPLSSEVIACVGFRPNILAMLFSLLAILSYFKSRDNIRPGRFFYFSLSLFCFFMALFCKEIAVFLPAALFVSEYYRQGGSLKKALAGWRGYLCYLAVALIYLWVYFFLRQPTQHIFDLGAGPGNILRMSDVFGAYLRDMVFPRDLVMVPPMQVRNSYLNIALGAVFIIGSIFVILKRRRFPAALSFGALWFFIWSLPMNNPLNNFRILLANRFMYLPLAGFAVIIAALLTMPDNEGNGFGLRFPLLKKVLPLACVAFFSIFTLTTNPLWKDELSVCMAVAEKYPHAPTGHVDLGEAWFKRGNYPEALREFDAAVSRSHNRLSIFDFTRIYSDAGMIYMSRGDYKKAEEKYREAIANEPGMPYFYVSLAVCYARQGLYARALNELDAAKRLTPSYVLAYIKSGDVYSLMGRHKDARREFEEALNIDPGSREAADKLKGLLDNRRGSDR
jgi:tetratricopeptide (TPR) repeat protein